MKRQRLHMIIVTVSVFSIAVVVTTLFAREIIQQSHLLREQVMALQTDQAQQTQLTKLKKLVTETENDRAALSSYYLASQSDSIDFLNYVEVLAKEKAVKLETSRAAEIEQNNKQYLVVEYSLQGSRDQLEQFVQLLETVPYVSEVTSLKLAKQTAVTWQANVTIEVIVLPQS